MVNARVTCRTLLLSVLIASASCHDDTRRTGPIAPSDIPGYSPIAQLAVTGNTSLAHPGETSQLTATTTMRDGTTQDVTASVTWEAFPANVVTVVGGLVTAVAYGSANVSASSGVSGAHVTVRVLPAGTFVLSGSITEEGGAFPLDNVEVEATSPAARVTTHTDPTGRYTLAPVPGDVAVQVEKEGFESLVKRWSGSDDGELDFALRRVGPPANVRGVYRLTVTASPGCALPPEANQRTYAARIEGPAEALVVSLDGADVVTSWDGGTPGFTGSLEDGRLRFEISASCPEYCVVERFEPGRDVCFSGTATGMISDDAGRIGLMFSGLIEVRGSGWATPGGPLGTCRAGDHRLEFVR